MEGVFDPDPFGGVNRSYRIVVTTLNQEKAYAVRDWVSQNGLTKPLPAFQGVMDIEVEHYSEAVFDVLTGDLALTVADDDAFVTMVLEVNGLSVATLGDGKPVTPGNGWDAVTFTIPSYAFHYDPTAGAVWENDYEIRHTVRGNPTTFRTEGSYQYVSE